MTQRLETKFHPWKFNIILLRQDDISVCPHVCKKINIADAHAGFFFFFAISGVAENNIIIHDIVTCNNN